ncbi:hypothetical protein, partial [Devosia sp.]|uniref:hypothetical protein n=1 Tax=Devosia sp. TaxID=1871048 RepID=UPI002EE9F9D7
TTMTPAFAGPFWVMGKTVKECYIQGVYVKDAAQVQCGSNSVDDEEYGYSIFNGNGGPGFPFWGGADGNTQIIKQDQKAFVWGVGEGQTLQVQLGTNDIEDGDDNKQIIDQDQALFGNACCEVQQMQVGKNDVEDGDDNFQKIEQSQTLVVFGGPG